MKMDTAAAVTKPVLRYHGGKWRLASWIISHFPAHRVYVEPFGGAASVLMQKPRSYAEVYNDLDGEIVNVFRVLQCPEKRARLCEMLHFTPYARAEFMLAWEPTDDPVEAARRVIIRAQMGFGSAGATRGTTGFRANARTKNRYTNEVSDHRHGSRRAGRTAACDANHPGCPDRDCPHPRNRPPKRRMEAWGRRIHHQLRIQTAR